MHYHRSHPYPTRRTRTRWLTRIRVAPAGWVWLTYIVALIGAVSAALYPWSR